jgi:hypothetical protein
VRENDLNADIIEEVVVDVPSIAYNFVVGQPFKIGDVPQKNTVFSLEYTETFEFY